MNIDTKILSIETLISAVDKAQENGKRVVLCHGVFDILHIGHIRYFRQAAQMGDVLVVTVTPDKYVDKGPHRPAFNEALRCECIASQEIVDYVAINKWPTAEELLRNLRPDVYVKGSDFKSIDSDPTGKLQLEAKVCEKLGISMRLTEDIVFSSTNLINRFMSNFSCEVQEYLEIFRSRYSLKEITDVLDAMQDITVTVVGDAILDDYQYCNPLGASSKDPVLALQHAGEDLFAGGVLAVANHVSNFVKNVQLCTVLGERESSEDFIRKNLNSNVTLFFCYQKKAPTIRKRRYVEAYSLVKLLEIYHMDAAGLDGEQDALFRNEIMERAAVSNLVMAADFGHGTISSSCRNDLLGSPFLAVNTQANAGNRGFHTISKYERCDFVSLTEPELRLDARDNATGIIPLTNRLQHQTNASLVAITRGKKGSFIQHADGTGVLVPAFVHRVVDRTGSGDAFFSIASVAASMGLQPEIVGFLGNVVGSIAVGIIGNQKSVARNELIKNITSLLK